MPCQSSVAFVAAYLDQKECELFADASGEMRCYCPTRASAVATISLGRIDYTRAEVAARQMGLSPSWN